VCPECSGPLWELANGSFSHFKCLVGHSYSPESLLEADTEAVERALWIAVRTLEERAGLLRRLAGQTEGKYRNLVAGDFLSRSRECEAQAQLVRRIAFKSSMEKDKRSLRPRRNGRASQAASRGRPGGRRTKISLGKNGSS